MADSGCQIAVEVSDPGPSPWEMVLRARNQKRPTVLELLPHIFDDFVELHGDRLSSDDPALVGGFATISGRPVVVLGQEKGRGTTGRIARRFGMPHPDGYRKAMRLMRLAARLHLPLVTFIDTPGAYPGPTAEESGQAWAIAECMKTLIELCVPTVAVIIGEGGSGGALALAATDRVFMLENAIYSVISPEGCSTILFGHPNAAPEMAACLGLTAKDLVRLGVADNLIPEPAGGIETSLNIGAQYIKATLVQCLDHHARHSVDELRKNRHYRLRYGPLPHSEKGRRDRELHQ
jgi:acetyl-CoA carboxylase carboxyl transferase subunit beta